MLGNQFFVPGREYQVITHRPDTRHLRHFFETGERVICVDVTRAYKKRTVKGHCDFQHEYLVGLFVNADGIDQTLATGDVKLCRS